jgi:lipoate-protein ligase A
LGHQAALVQEAYSTMTAVNEIAPAPIAIPTLHQALQEAFADSFGITMIQNPLELVEERLATELRTSKYATSVWNLEGAAAWRRNLADTAASKYL